ncbi:hypothetical protein MMC11_002308 [Xylographa trunciseda]|nr:hypothetical protein [Xylographa trunciseda]
MPLPPEFLKLKRKRHEELPGTLFVQKEHRDPKRSFTDTAWQFRKVSDTRSPSLSAKSGALAAHHKPDSKYAPQVPKVRATLPGEEDTKIQELEHFQHNSVPRQNHDKSSTLFQDLAMQSQASHVDRRRHEPRRFHLTRDSISYSYQVQASKSGILKHKKGLNENLPIFSERARGILSTMVSNGTLSSQDEKNHEAATHQTEQAREDTKPLLKRPNASAAEKQWRAQNWKKPVQEPTVDEPLMTAQAEDIFLAAQRDHEALKLAAELQKFALQQTQGDSVSGHLARPAKIKPKLRPNRHAYGPSGHDSLGDHAIQSKQEDESGWIVETYVRKANPAASTEVGVSAMGSYAHAADFGLLVIPEEDEPAWEVFGEDEGGDSEESSDGSDSNAEDYYANDYPEDEVNSDDEYGRGAYRYRHADSDDEEYDEHAMSYSDEEATVPWKRGMWADGEANVDDHKGGTGLTVK